jgi:hypothetical protein
MLLYHNVEERLYAIAATNGQVHAIAKAGNQAVSAVQDMAQLFAVLP